jgi:hypothetical protein
MMLLEYMDTIVAWVWVGGLMAGIATFGFIVWLAHPNSNANRQEAERRKLDKEEADRALLESGFEP